jgi:PPOX class probable F420-dependent enzyme
VLAAVALSDSLDNSRYAVLTTYRRNGQPVATPVWFALDGDRAVFFTGPRTGKAKRIRNNPHVEMAPSTARGKAIGPSVSVTARLLGGAEAAAAARALEAKYGWQWRLWSLYERLRGWQRVFYAVESP